MKKLLFILLVAAFVSCGSNAPKEEKQDTETGASQLNDDFRKVYSSGDQQITTDSSTIKETNQ